MENSANQNINKDQMPSTKNGAETAIVNDGSHPDGHKEKEQEQVNKEAKENPVLGETKSKISDETTI